jgi:hypothetical protein
MTPREYVELAAQAYHGTDIVEEGVHYNIEVRDPEDFSYWILDTGQAAIENKVLRMGDVLVDKSYEFPTWEESCRHPELAGLAERAAEAWGLGGL